MLNRKIEGDAIVFYDGDAVVLTVCEKEGDNLVTLEMKGELRSDTAHEVQDELVAFATVGIDIIVDLSGVTYVAPTAQHIFLRTQQKIDSIGKGSLLLTGLAENVYREFAKSGLSELLMIKQ